MIARASTEQCREISFVGQMIFNRLSQQLDLTCVDGSFNFGVKNGLILQSEVSQIESQGNVLMECALLVLSNMFGAPLLISIGHFDGKFRTPIMNTLLAVSGQNNSSTLEQMRRKIIKYLGNNNVLVDLPVALTLVALQLPGNAERVVDLLVELAFATLSYSLARTARRLSNTGPGGTVREVGSVANLFVEQMASRDRRWRAFLFENGIEFWKNKCNNMYSEAVYTAACCALECYLNELDT